MTEDRNSRSTPAVGPAQRRRDLLTRMAGGLLLPPLVACTNHSIIGAPAEAQRAREAAGTMSVIVDQSTSGPLIGSGYVGFSYEKSSLHTGYFTASNRPLVRLFRRLGTGLLRLGGNSVDRTSWRRSSADNSAPTVGPADIDALSTFLQASGWQALYGINLATNTPAAAAEEARYVARSLGRHLYGFEIGNEPDAYAFNQLRPSSYSYRQFLGDWSAFARAVQQEVPYAPLTGPASAWHETSWTAPFAKDEGRHIVLLTQHYYRANGLSPGSTLDLLLAGDPALPGLLGPLREASSTAGIRDGYRLTEANSFYDGGAPHISNTFGTALWAIDFLFANARLGSSGVNFHGGGAAPGYTPIADDGRTVVEVRPEYYGMLLFSLMGPGHLLPTIQSATRLSVSAYAVACQGQTCIVLVNKEPTAAIDVEIVPGVKVQAARVMTLSAPGLESVRGITLDNASIDTDGNWSPQPSTILRANDGSLALRLGPASAVLLTAT